MGSSRRTARSYYLENETKGPRSCQRAGCDTILSKYNQHDYCWDHTPARIPRERGGQPR